MDLTTIIIGILIAIAVLFLITVFIAEGSMFSAIVRARRKYDRIR